MSALDCTPRSRYQKSIAVTLANAGRLGIDPAHVEAYMRVSSPTLDGLSAEQFDRLAIEAADDVALDPALAAEVAESYGL